MEISTYDLITGQLSGTETLDSSSAADSRLPPSTAAPKYPYNNATITRAGHEMHWDDTPGRERIRLSHKTGTYFEISEDGRKVELVQTNDYKYIKGGLTLTIDKNGDIKVGGNIRLVVGGDAHIEVNGNVTTSIGGDLIAAVNKNAEIHAGSDVTVTAGGNITATASKNIYASAGQDLTSIVAGNMTAVVNGDSYELVSGSKTVEVTGDYTISAASINMTSSGEFNITGDNVNMLSSAEFNITGDKVFTHAITWNAWDTYGVGYVYTNNHIYTYTNGVPSTSNAKQPPKIPTP